MTTEWFYQSMGQIVGPLTAKELLQKVRAQDITPNTLVRKDDSQWVEAEQVGGLFEAAARPEVQHLCPYCGRVVSKPPVTCTNCDRYLSRTYTIRDSSYQVPGSRAATSSEEEDGRIKSLLVWIQSWLD